MGVKRAASLYGHTTASMILLVLGFFLEAAFAGENRVHAYQEVDSPSNKTSSRTQDDHSEAETDGSAKTFFPAGTWNLYSYAAAAVGKTSRKVYAGNIGLGHYIIDDFSLNLQAAGYFVDHARDTGGGGVDMLFRWHPFYGRAWSLYMDGSPGFIYTRKTLRDPGTHFNFTVQGGMGATYKLTGRLHSMAGIRWFHISNARIRGKNRNVGFDSPMFYLGLMFPY